MVDGGSAESGGCHWTPEERSGEAAGQHSGTLQAIKQKSRRDLEAQCEGEPLAGAQGGNISRSPGTGHCKPAQPLLCKHQTCLPQLGLRQERAGALHTVCCWVLKLSTTLQVSLLGQPPVTTNSSSKSKAQTASLLGLRPCPKNNLQNLLNDNPDGLQKYSGCLTCAWEDALAPSEAPGVSS